VTSARRPVNEEVDVIVEILSPTDWGETVVELDRDLLWMAEGYQYFNDQLASIEDTRLAEPSGLPGWTRKHVVAHVAFNARGLCRLARWAATGEVTPMYASVAARGDEIAEGARWPASRLRDLVLAEQGALTEALSGLDSAGWSAEVALVSGRPCGAVDIPWMRVRELWIHAVDLGVGGDFADFPTGLVDELIVDVLARRREEGQAPVLDIRPTDRDSRPHPGDPASSAAVEGRAGDLARWLTGRGSAGVRSSGGGSLPELGPWR
jgi:maleylpyruvate isomerase